MFTDKIMVQIFEKKKMKLLNADHESLQLNNIVHTIAVFYISVPKFKSVLTKRDLSSSFSGWTSCKSPHLISTIFAAACCRSPGHRWDLPFSVLRP